jgi:cytosine/adenosine deaminase-related metal-dependent hydrolase
MTIAYHAEWIFPVSQPPIRHGYITVAQDRVIEVRTSAPSGTRILELGAVAILPKPVNTHTHLEFSNLKRPLGKPRESFAAWIGEVLTQRATNKTPKEDCIQRGLAELRDSLSAAVGEIATLPSQASNYAQASIGGTAFHELLSTNHERGLARLAEIVALADGWPSEIPLSFGLSPHAPYTVEWRLLEKAVEVAGERNWPVAMHLGESIDEMELLASHSGKLHQLLRDRGVWNPSGLPRGIRLSDYLSILAKAPRALAIHGNFLGKEEHEILARNRAHLSLVICPRTCHYFLPALPPIDELIAKGVHVAIGTDSRATNPDLSIWNEAQFLIRTAPNLTPQEILRLVTLAGAMALGLDDKLGQIKPGVSVDCLAISGSIEAINGMDDALANVFEGALHPLSS